MQRANHHILNILEGNENSKNPIKFMLELLMQVMGPKVFAAPPELERTHQLSDPVKGNHLILGMFLQISREGCGIVLGQKL